MPEISPTSRYTVRKRIEDLDHIHATAPVGEGILAVYNSDLPPDHVSTYTRLMEECGWYVSSYESQKHGDVATLMPVGEVPEEPPEEPPGGDGE